MSPFPDEKPPRVAFGMYKRFALAGAVLTFFGLIHAEAIGIMKTPGVAAAYLVVAAFLYACSLKKSAETAAEADTSDLVAQAA